MLYIRPFAFGSSEMIGLMPPSEFTFCVFVKPVSAYHGTLAQDALVLLNFDRAAPRGQGHAKVGGNYAPVIKWSEKAKADGFGMTLHLDSKTRTEIDEFSTSGFLGIKVSNDGSVKVVAPDSPCIIRSITSDCCLQLAKHYGWTIEKRPIKYTELSEFSEVIAVGTAASVVSIRSITNEETQERFRYLDPASNQGPFARVLSVALDDIMRCKAADLFGWCHQVGEPALEQPVEVDIHHKVEDTSNYFRTDGKKAVFTDILMLSGSGSGARHACH
ncbi:branched-chain amino acid aminotransferase [Fusarium subglutinans]|uniref:Branched-chain amino acid aminotransferase n=1 Tax=Gibberella subglutinans TaxID=42677 RepID=A0A8H5KM21_GIBSU|nr:branched-chain amino acid aminotransferase [Fusarium subglutinans]KAF5574856.1 branched-chain amino acid aminotransferase [Fusarium subglutinans]